MNNYTHIIDALFEEKENTPTVYHEQKLFCVNGQMVIDRECQEHPLYCYARNIARKFYKPTFSYTDEETVYGISRTDIITINIDGTEKEITRVKNNLKKLCAQCCNSK